LSTFYRQILTYIGGGKQAGMTMEDLIKQGNAKNDNNELGQAQFANESKVDIQTKYISIADAP
jgi:hypothetical protein